MDVYGFFFFTVIECLATRDYSQVGVCLIVYPLVSFFFLSLSLSVRERADGEKGLTGSPLFSYASVVGNESACMNMTMSSCNNIFFIIMVGSELM